MIDRSLTHLFSSKEKRFKPMINAFDPFVKRCCHVRIECTVKKRNNE